MSVVSVFAETHVVAAASKVVVDEDIVDAVVITFSSSVKQETHPGTISVADIALHHHRL